MPQATPASCALTTHRKHAPSAIRQRMSSLMLGLLCTLACVEATAKEPAPRPQNNLAATRSHYAQLLAGPSPRLAELSLFARLMPKGGDLHHHFSGALYAETYLEWLGALNYCVYAITDLDDPKYPMTKFQIETDPARLPDTLRAHCKSASAVLADTAFYRDLLQAWSDKDYANHAHSQVAPDQHFFDTFDYFGPVSATFLRRGLQLLKARAQAENLGYLETMLKGGPATTEDTEFNRLVNGLTGTPTASPAPLAPEQVDAALNQAVELLVRNPANAIEQKVEAYVKAMQEAAVGLDDAGFRLRLQAYASRNSAPAKVFSSLYTSFAAAARSPLVVAVNIVGPENGVVAMRDYGLHMRMFAVLRKRFPDVRLALHAGELVPGMVPLKACAPTSTTPCTSPAPIASGTASTSPRKPTPSSCSARCASARWPLK